jgi:hypothetical protein
LEPYVNGSDRRGLRGVIAGKRSERSKIPDPERTFTARQWDMSIKTSQPIVGNVDIMSIV